MIDKLADFVYKYFLFFLPVGRTHPWDYAAHSIVSLVITFILFFSLNIPGISFRTSAVISILATLAIGITKELNDLKTGRNDIISDLIADGLGIIVAFAIILIIKKLTA